MSFICRAPWTSIAFQPTGMAPCCVYEFQPDHNDSFDAIKQQFLNNEIPAGCNKCKQAFESNCTGAWQGFDRYQTDFEQNNIQEINVKSNNFCNLACRSCGPHFSSKWEKEFNEHVIITKDHGVLEKIKQLDFSKLKRIVFAGGEPTLTDEHLFVLNHLIENNLQNIEIQISTNGLILEYKNIHLIDLWSKFPNLNLQLSVDAVGQRANAIRSGTDWNLLEKNLKIVKNSNIKHLVNITISALNVWYLDQTIDYLKNELSIKNLRYNLLYNPDILNIRVIHSKYRDIINTTLDRCIDQDTKVQEIKNYFNASNNEEAWPHFLIYNLMLDINRKENFFNDLPIKQDLLNTWVKL
jgi:sulfatase maturation enzyme AslB (radical SAM superfamily)